MVVVVLVLIGVHGLNDGKLGEADEDLRKDYLLLAQNINALATRTNFLL